MPANKALLDEVMYELIKDKLSKGQYEGQKLADAARKCEEARLLCSAPEEMKCVKKIRQDKTREWLRYERICRQVAHQSFSGVLERIEKEKQMKQ